MVQGTRFMVQGISRRGEGMGFTTDHGRSMVKLDNASWLI